MLEAACHNIATWYVSSLSYALGAIERDPIRKEG